MYLDLYTVSATMPKVTPPVIQAGLKGGNIDLGRQITAQSINLPRGQGFGLPFKSIRLGA